MVILVQTITSLFCVKTIDTTGFIIPVLEPSAPLVDLAILLGILVLYRYPCLRTTIFVFSPLAC